MPDEKNPAKTPKADSPAKPKAKVAKPALKAAPGKPEVGALKPEVKVKKTRANKRRANATIADLSKKQFEFDAVKKSTKANLKKQYSYLVKGAKSIKDQYKEIFPESIESAQKVRGVRAQRGTGSKTVGLAPFALDEIKSFLEQKRQSRARIKISGIRPRTYG
jgi:hypothetical protein